MKKKLLISILTIFLFANSYAQSSLWSKIPEEKMQMFNKMERASIPSKYELFSLDFAALKSQLQLAPLDNLGGQSSVIIAFPNPKGELQNYRIYDAPVMEAELANKYQGIKSYVGKGIEDPTATIRFSVTLFGLHVMAVSGDAGTFYIDTYTKDLNNYIVYDRKDLQGSRGFSCQVEDDHEKVAQQNASFFRSNDSKFRTYRFAMACTIEYSAFHVNAAGLGAGTLAQKTAAVLSAMTVTMTRVNAVYERDLAVRMNLVANNDVLIFIDFDSFNNTSASTLINQSQSVINAAIGTANYDIGHTVSTGGGGLAGLGVVCVDGQKARGITGSPSPVGDPYDIDYVAHEVGHQFGANHTFNGNTGNCAGNRNDATAVEPGSGSTIMAYAGICSGVDVQGNSDAYFHTVSLGEIFNHITGTGNCAAFISNGNTPPVANAGLDYTIPNGTAFILTGSATDANGDALTYCWEQTDNQVSTQPPVATAASGPNFRSVSPTSSPSRFFPRIEDVLTGTVTPTWEVVPTGIAVNRTMNFALTVRDNRSPNGGQTARDNMTVTFRTGQAFAVTSQNTDGIVWAPSSSQTITWNVAATTAAPYNLANVRILLSTDGGLTYLTVLLASTANDGTEAITVPIMTQPNCRIKVEPIGNIFYSVNVKNIAIGNYTYQTQNVCTDYVQNFSNLAIPENSASFTGYAINVPDTYTLTDTNVKVELTHAEVGSVFLGLRPAYLTTGVTQFFNGACDGSANMNLTFDDQGTAINCANTTSQAATLPATTFATYNGTQVNGSWIFFITDIAVGDGITGTLQKVTLNLCKSSLVPVLANETFGLDNFTIYPNPNNGNFNVQFTSNTGNQIKVGVHDMRGRLVFENEFQNTGMFNQNLQLSKIQSGIYIVTVQDGERKEVNKIIVN